MFAAEDLGLPDGEVEADDNHVPEGEPAGGANLALDKVLHLPSYVQGVEKTKCKWYTIVKPKSKSPIPCPNRPNILTLSPDQV